MLFFTNRRIKNISNGTALPRAVEFDLSVNTPCNEVFFCERIDKNNYKEIGHYEFFKNLRETNFKQILVYIHGFNNLPEDGVFSHAKHLQNYFDSKEKNSVLVLPLIWPCDNDFGIIQDYWDDQVSADMSGFSIKRALNFFQDWSAKTQTTPCCKFINVLAHSMGSRVLRSSLMCWKQYNLNTEIPRMFRNVFLVAADLVNESLEYGKNGEVICDSARNVVVYHANDDLALRASKVMNLKNRIASRRLGHTGPEKIENTPKNVFTVDCDEVNNVYDFPEGHTYFLPSEKHKVNRVLEHIYSVLETGRFNQDGKRNIIIANK